MEIPNVLAVFLILALAIISRGYILSEWMKWARKGRDKQIASANAALKQPAGELTDKQNRIQARVLQMMPDVVRVELKKFPSGKTAVFSEEYFRRSREVLSAYCFFVLFGIHYSYLEENRKQWYYWFTLGGLLIWAVVDIFRIPAMVAQYNRNLAAAILREIETSERVNL